jgi:DNA-binding response OmpR family regulator
MATTRKTRVLLVDDDSTLLASMAAILEDHFDITTSTSPLAALSLVAAERFDVVCMDWKMPEMDGIEFFHALERQQAERMPSCILITAHTAEVLDQVSVESRKILGMLRKPFAPRDLVERVTLFANLARMKHSNTRLKAAVRGTG